MCTFLGSGSIPVSRAKKQMAIRCFSHQLGKKAGGGEDKAPDHVLPFQEPAPLLPGNPYMQPGSQPKLAAAFPLSREATAPLTRSSLLVQLDSCAGTALQPLNSSKLQETSVEDTEVLLVIDLPKLCHINPSEFSSEMGKD